MSIIAIDSEWTVDLETWCFTVCVKPHHAYLVWPDDIIHLKDYIEDSLVVWHNAIVDKPRLEACGIYPKHEIDTMIMAAHLGQPQGLKSLSYRLCGIRQRSYKDVVAPVERVMARDYLEAIAACEWDDPPPVEWWNPKPKMERLYEEIKKPCTQRKREAIQCNCGSVSFPVDNCPVCSGKGYYYLCKNFLSYEVVPGTENGHMAVSQPQNIGSLAAGAIKRESDAVDTLAKWKTDGRLAQVEDVLGTWLGADLSMVPLDEAVQYACADADATLQVAVELYKLYKQSGIPMPNNLNVLEEMT